MVQQIIDFLITGIEFCFDVFSRFVTGGLLDLFIGVFTILVIGRFLLMPLMAGRLPSGSSDNVKSKNNKKESNEDG